MPRTSCASMCLHLLLAVAPVCALRLVSHDPAPTSEKDAQEQWDMLLDELDENALTDASANYTPSAELISAWSEAWKESGDLSKSQETKETMQAAVARCKNLVSSHLSYDKMHSIAEHGGHYCADPWFETKDCSKSFSIPGYRLGDLFKEKKYEAKYIKKLYPGSIGAKFVQSDPNFSKKSEAQKYAQLYEVITRPDYADYEKPNVSDLVIHVRAFDILHMCGGVEKVWHEKPSCGGWKALMVKGQKYWSSVLASKDLSRLARAVLVTGDHMTVSTNTTQNKVTDEYLKRISDLITDQAGLPVTLRKNGNPDCDFIYMANTKPANWIRTGGGYDRLVDQMVKLGGQQ